MYMRSLSSESVSRTSVVPKWRQAGAKQFFQSKIQRKCSECEKEEKEQVQRKENTARAQTGGEGSSAPSIVSSVLSSGSGRPMDAGTRKFMESRFGQDFGQVRIHTDGRAAESAAAIQARAYTSGKDVVFGKGEYQPSQESGQRLLAHELAHVGQQRGTGAIRGTIQKSNGHTNLQSSLFSGNSILESVSRGDRFIKQGARGDHVQRIQSGLLRIGLVLPRFGADGVFGQETINAVRYFQQAQGLASDAIVGPQTIIHLDSMLTNHTTIPPNPVIPEQTPSNTASPASGTQSGGRKVSTLCHRDFQTVIPGWLARHCFVWGHDSSIPATVGQIRQDDTMTFDADVSGVPDPVPLKNTACTKTYPVDPQLVRQHYRSLCKPRDYNMVSFNCCTCAYLALSAAGARLSANDFPRANEGIGLPQSHGLGPKRIEMESKWFNNIDELEEILDNNITIEQIRLVPLEMKTTWVNTLLGGIYTTENEGKIIIKIFKGTYPSDRRTLYQMVEGHPWGGDWREGASVIDDKLVDNLYRSQLNELRNIINGV